MNFNVAMLKAMRDEGLTFEAAIRIFEAGEIRRDPTATERKRRQRAKEAADRDMSQRDVTRDPPNERDNLNPPEVSEDKSSSPQPWSLPVGVSLQVWTDLKANRKRKRLPNTPTAWKGFLDDLARVSAQTGIPPPKLIEQCTAKGWGAIYDPREQGNKSGRRTETSKIRGTLDQLFPADQREGSEVGIAGLPDPGRTAQPWH